MKRVLGPAITVVVALAAVGLFVFGLSNQGASRALDNAVAAGKRPAAPDRRLPILAAPGSRSLASYRGKVLVVNFWASWCPPCAAESGLLEAAQRQLAAGGRGTVLGVDYKDFTSDSVAFIRRHGLTYPSLLDSTGGLANAFGTESLPETFVLDRNSRIVAISRGQILQQSFLTQAIAKAEQA